MQPFGDTVLAWRLARGMTQAALATAAGVPRPNLSAIERGDREVTLKTLRALAVALTVKPGVLADGILPHGDRRPLTRAGLERVALAAVRDLKLPDPREATLAKLLRAAVRSQVDSKWRYRSARSADRAYFLLKTSETPETVASLVERVAGAHRRTLGLRRR